MTPRPGFHPDDPQILIHFHDFFFVLPIPAGINIHGYAPTDQVFGQIPDIDILAACFFRSDLSQRIGVIGNQHNSHLDFSLELSDGK